METTNTPNKQNRILMALSIISTLAVIVLVLYINAQIKKFAAFLDSIPTVQPVSLEINVASQNGDETTDNANIILGNAAGAMHFCKSDNVHDCESVTVFFANGNMEALWTREINPNEGAILLGLSDSSEDGMYVAVVSKDPNGLQEIHILNSSFMVMDTLKLDPADYGKIESISGMIVTEFGQLTNMIIVTEKGHFQYHIGNGTPSIDQTH